MKTSRLLQPLLTLALSFAMSLLVWSQGALTNGYTHTGSISVNTEVDAWTITATNGDSLIIRVAEISQTNAFEPRITLLTPGAVQQATANGLLGAEVAVTATNTGTFTVNVDDVERFVFKVIFCFCKKLAHHLKLYVGKVGVADFFNSVVYFFTIKTGMFVTLPGVNSVEFSIEFIVFY